MWSALSSGSSVYAARTLGGGGTYPPRAPPAARVSRQNCGYPKLVRSSRASHDQVVQQRLWNVSQELTGVTFPV